MRGGILHERSLYYLEGMIDQLMDRKSYRNDVFFINDFSKGVVFSL